MPRFDRKARDGRRRKQRRTAFRAPEPLEKRQLLAVAPLERPDDLTAVVCGGRPLVVVDASLPAPDSLARSFGDSAATVVVAAGDDLFGSVTAELDRLGGVSAIHLVSHGLPGSFTLGSTRFALDTVDQIDDGLVAWNRLAGPGADLYLWGCDIAAGDGASLLDAIHTVSGFDVAASLDATGPARLGGDFDLEYAVGDVAAPSLVAGVDVLWDTTLGGPAAPTDYTFTAAAKTAINAAFNRLQTDIAPAVKTALQNAVTSTSTDQFAQRTVSDLFTAASSLSPADVQSLLTLASSASTYLGGGTATLSGLAAALQTQLTTLATTAGAAGPQITVTPTVTATGSTATKIELAVSIAARATTTAPLDRGPDASPTAWGQVLAGLDSDLNLKLRSAPQLETGAEFTGAFTISLDLSDPDVPVASIAIPTLDLKAGLFGFSAVAGRVGALDISVGGTATPVHATSVTVTNVNSGTPGATASPLSTAPTATVTLPVTAKLGGTDVSTADTKITVTAANVLDATAKPAVALSDFDKLQWFGAISSDDIITAVLSAGRAYGAMASAEGSVLATRVPFAANQTLGSVFDFADLFADEIGSQIDVTVDKTVNGTTTKVRPDDLQTFGDFARKFPALGITPVYDAATGAVSIQFSASRTNAAAVKPAVEFPIAPLGTLGFTPDTATPLTAPVAINFGVRFDLAPSAPLAIQLPTAATSSWKLSKDAVFTVTPAFGTAETVTVDDADTQDNGSAADLLADVNRALADTPLRARASQFGGGFELYTPTVGTSMPAAITITANRSVGNRELGFSDGLADDAGSPYTLFARTSAAGSRVVPHATEKFAAGSFDWSLADRTGGVAYGLNTIGFADTTGSVKADFSLALAATGADAETLGSDPTSVLTATLTDAASLRLEGLYHANGASTIKSGSTITIGVSDFTKERIDVFTPQGGLLAVENLEADGSTTGRLSDDATGATIRFTWRDVPYALTVTAAEAADNTSFDDLVDDFAAALADLSADFIVEGADGQLSIRLKTAGITVLADEDVPNLAPGGADTGRLSADAVIEAVIGSATYTVTVPRSATLDNTSFADLVADVNDAVATASRSVAGGVGETVDATDDLRFQASGSFLQPLAPVTVANPAYAAVTVPAKEDLGEIGYQAGLTAASVATALREAGRVFPMLTADLAAYAEIVLPLLNAPLADLIALDTGYTGRVETLRAANVTSIGGLERAIETALGLPAKDLGISFDKVRNAYRIDLAYRTSATKKVGFDLALESYYEELGKLMPQGINELADANGKSPLTVVLAATSVLSVGIDLTTNQTFLYGYDAAATLPGGSTLDPALAKGTSFRIDVSVNGKNLEFPARLGFFVKGGTAKIENGALVATLAGPTGTPAASPFYVSPTSIQRDALDVANYAAAFAGKVEVVMPIFDEFTPATVTAASASEAGSYGLKQPASLYLGIPDLGTYARIRAQIDEARAALLQLRQSGGGTVGGKNEAAWETALEAGELQLPSALQAFAPELTAAKELLGASPTLMDAIRDPAIILDTLDTMLRYAENSMAGIGKLDLPLIGNSLGGAVNGLFGFRRGWLLDMRQKLRGQGESLLDVMRQQIFDFLGPQGTGILLVNNGLRSAEGMVGATKPTDVGLEFLDKAGKKVSTDVRGADGFEITVRIGQKLFDTGVDLGFQFDALEPLIKLGLDGGLRLQMGWDIQLGFGFSLTNGAYIKLDPDSPEAQVRFDATLTGKSAEFKPQFVSAGVWKIVDGNGNDVVDPSTGSAYRAIAVDKKGVNVTATVPQPGSDEAKALDPCEDGTPPTKTSSGQVWWVVAAEARDSSGNGTGVWRPAELNSEMRYVAQSGDRSFDTGAMIEVTAMKPASLSGSLAFLTLTATDMVRRGLAGVTDYDNTYLFDASEGPQVDAKARDNPDKGVNRNNQLATMFSGVIGIDIVDPSANKKAFQAVPDDAVGPDKLKLADAKGTAVLDNGQPVPVRKFYEFKLRQGPGSAYKPLDRAVRVATTANIRLGGIGIVDGVQLRANDRVLVKNQVDAADNGVYTVTAGEWKRALDADDFTEWDGGQVFVFVEEGRTNKQTGWAVDERVGDITLGTTDIIFTRVETVSVGGVLKPYEPFTTVLLPEAVVDKPLTKDLQVVVFYDGSEFVVTLPATSSTGAANRAAQLSFALRNAFEDTNGNRQKDADEGTYNLLQAGFAFPIPTEPKAKAYVVEQPKTPATGTRVIQPDGWDPVRDINADASKNRLTFAELRAGGLGIFKLDVVATAVANFQLTLSLGDSATLPKIFADLNLDWSTKSARAKIAKSGDTKDAGGATTGADKGIDPNAAKTTELDLLPEIGLSNVRLDLGSFLTKFVKPIVDEADPYLDQIRPIIDFLTMRIDPLSSIAGTDIRVIDLLETFGGEKAKGVRPVIDTVAAISNIVSMIADLPQGFNVQLPLGRFWFPKEANKQTGEYEYGAFRYDNKAVFASSGDPDAIDKALKTLKALKDANPDSAASAAKQKGIKNAADRGGFRLPILENPLTAFKLMMGQDVPLFTFQLPKLQYQLEKSVPLARIVCFEVGLKMGFELNSKLAFGFDTYGFRLYGDSGDVLDIGQGFYVSDRANADGTGPDTPEFQAIVNFGLYGGIDVLIAKGGVEGGVRVTAEVDLNDPNNDGKLRLPEFVGLLTDHDDDRDLLDPFDLSLRGEIYARYYYDVFGLISGGADFARLELFNLKFEGRDGPPLYASKITSQSDDGTPLPGTLLLHVGENAAKRVSNEDPFKAQDKAERFAIRNVGDTVYVKFLDYDESEEQSFTGVKRVLFAGGAGNDSLDASGLSDIPLFFDGGAGNDTVKLGSGHATIASRLVGDDGNDTIEVFGGGIVVIDGGLGSDTITGGTGTVWIDPGAGDDKVTTRAGSATTLSFSDQYGLDTLTLATGATVNLLDFTNVYSSVVFGLDGTAGTAAAGDANSISFNVPGVTEIRGTSSPDTFRVKNPETRNANSGKGLILRGSLGDDVYEFTIDDASQIAADGILVDDVRPVTAATAGTPTVAGKCKSIQSIPVASAGSGYTVAPDVVIFDATGYGYGAKATATIDEQGRVVSIQVIEEGRDYTSPTVLLVNAVSYADKLTFTSNRPAADLTRSGTTYALGIDGKQVRFEGWSGVGTRRPKGFDASEIDSVTVNLPQGLFTLGAVEDRLGDSIDLFDTFTVSASRMVQNARIVADTVAITTDHGFQVKHAIDTTNSGDVRIRVTGRANNDDSTDDINVAANLATATATVSGGTVTGLALTKVGANYFFDPSITVGAEIASAGTGARFTATRTGDSLAGFAKLSGGSGYLTSPAPIVVIPPPASIQIDAMVTSSAPGGRAGLGDGRGKVILFADTGMVSTSGEVFFPTDTRPGAPQGSRVIDWIGGDYRYRTTTALDDLASATTYPGISVGTGAEFTAVLDKDGRVTGFTRQSGGSGYSQDLPPQVEVEGLATATAIVGDDGSILGLTVTYPGDGYGQPPKVTVRPNGFGRIVNSPSGPTTAADGTPLNRVHIRSIGGTLVAVAGAGVGDPLKPLKSDVETFVAKVTGTGRGVHLLEKDGVRVGADSGVSGITTTDGDVTLTTFGGAIELGAPKQALDSQGRPLWQDAAKTIPIYERDPKTNKIVYEGGQITVGSGDVKLTADDVEVNVSLEGATVGGTIELQPVKVNAQIGLAGTRARTAGIVQDGKLIGFDATKFWGGRGYTTAPLVIVDPAGQRAFGSAVVQDGQVVAIDVVFAGTNYSADDPPKVTLSGGGGRDAEATAVVGPGGVITGFTITNGGGGYASAPSVSIASPGQALVQAILESKPDPVSGRYSVKEFRVTNAGRNYTTAPNIEVAAPYDFTLDGDEIAQFDTAFTQVVIGRIEGQHLFHSPEASLGSGVVLRAPRAGGTLDVAALSATGPVSIVGSGSTFHFDTAAPTISGASISIDDNVIVHAGVEGVVTGTDGGITIFGTGKGMIDGSPTGDDVGDDEDLLLAARTTITVTGAVGSRHKLDDLTVTSATRGAVMLQQSVAVTGDLRITGGAVTIGGVVDVLGDLVIDASSMVTFSADVTVGGDVLIVGASGVSFSGRLTAGGTITISQVPGTLRFAGNVTAGDDFAAASTTLIEVLGGFTAAGNARFTSDAIDFKGGMATVVGGAARSLTLEPATASRPIRVGSPTGGPAGSLDISDADLAAIAAGWNGLVIGQATAGTGAVTIGSIGTRQGSRNSWLSTATTIVGGSVNVAQKVDVAATAAHLRLVARTGDIVVNAAINETAGERNGWLRLEADRAIRLKAPIFAAQTVSLVSGTTTGQTDAAPIAAPGLRLTAGGPVSLAAAQNEFDTLAARTTDAALQIREQTGFSIATVDGVTGLALGAGQASIRSGGDVVFDTPVTLSADAGVDLRGGRPDAAVVFNARVDGTGVLTVAGFARGSGPVQLAQPIRWRAFTTADTGMGSLRQVIGTANAVGVRGVVDLSDHSGSSTIFTLASDLPAITTPLVIDGTGRGVVIDGNRAARNGLVLQAGAAGSAIRQLTLRNFVGFGIRLEGVRTAEIDRTTVTSLNTLDSMGLYATGDLAGTRIIRSTFSGGLRGALLDGARNLVFGELGRGNTLSGNRSAPAKPSFAGTGIRAQGDCSGTVVTGNEFTNNNVGFAFVGAQRLALIGNRFTRNGNAGIFVEGVNTGSRQAENTFGTGSNRNKTNIKRQNGARGI